jgi:hypothetical protein
MGALVPGRYPDGRELSTGLLLSLVGDIIGAAAAAAAVVLAAAVEEAGFLLPRPARGVVDLVVLGFLLGIGGMGDLPRDDVRVRLVVTTLVEEGVLCWDLERLGLLSLLDAVLAAAAEAAAATRLDEVRLGSVIFFLVSLTPESPPDIK